MFIYEDRFLDWAKETLNKLKEAPLENLKKNYESLRPWFLHEIENSLTPEIEQVYQECLDYLEERISKVYEVEKENIANV